MLANATQSSSERRSESPSNSAAPAPAPGRNPLAALPLADAEQRLAPPAPVPAGRAPSFGPTDPKNLLDNLHPAMAAKAREFFSQAHALGLNIRVHEGMRTFAKQTELYAQGRTKKGRKVTNAKAGYSYHNYGLAADIVFNGGEPYGEKHPWSKIGAAARAVGLQWGGDWKKITDRPHIQLGDFSIKNLLAWHNAGGMTRVWDEVSAVYGGPKSEGPPESVEPEGTYRVRAGDTLSKIAQRFLGSAARWRELAEINGISDPSQLRVGQVLELSASGPPKNAPPIKPPTSSSPKGPQPAGTDSIVVARGDTLSSIALRVLGDAQRWPEIAAANNIANPNALRVGQVLKVPSSRPTSVTVARGDTLSSIAKTTLGNAQRWPELAAFNKLSNPSAIEVGQVIRIPQ